MQFVMYNGKLSTYQHSFLPRDAIHKRGLCHHAASVCPSVTFLNCVETGNLIVRFFTVE